MVFDTVTDHRDLLALPLPVSDLGCLLTGQHLGDDRVDSQLPGDPLGGGLIVPAEHDHRLAHRPQPGRPVEPTSWRRCISAPNSTSSSIISLRFPTATRGPATVATAPRPEMPLRPSPPFRGPRSSPAAPPARRRRCRSSPVVKRTLMIRAQCVVGSDSGWNGGMERSAIADSPPARSGRCTTWPWPTNIGNRSAAGRNNRSHSTIARASLVRPRAVRQALAWTVRTSR